MYLSGHNFLNMLSDIRDLEAPVSNSIEILILSMSSDTFQSVTFPGDVIFNS